LGETGNPDAVPVLLEHLGHERAILQMWVVQSLGVLKDERAVDSLIALLQPEVPSSLRYMAVEALGRIGDKRALPMIRGLRDDPDHHVRERVETALHLFGEPG
jgi:HEAT repeat protein